MRNLLIASLAAAASLLTACAASPAGTASGDSADLRQPQSEPGVPASATPIAHNHVFHPIDLGMASAQRGKNLGQAIDGKVATVGSAGLVPVVEGAAATTHEDGPEGIDSAFGSHVMPALLALGGSDPEGVSAALASDDAGDLLSAGAIDPAGEYQLVLQVAGTAGAPVQIVLPVTHVQIGAPSSDDPTGIRQGVFSGLLPVDKTAVALKSFAIHVIKSPPPWVLDALDQTVAQASDVHVDGVQDPTRPRDGISIAFHFAANDGSPTRFSPKSSVPRARPAGVPFVVAN
jgi:hypothetical protein